jgi:hypothetical protein
MPKISSNGQQQTIINYSKLLKNMKITGNRLRKTAKSRTKTWNK